MKILRYLLILTLLFTLPLITNCDSANSQDNTIVSVMVVSERAYKSGTAMEGAQCSEDNLAMASELDWNQVVSGMVFELLEALSNGEKGFDSFDWNTALGAAGTLTGNPLEFIETNGAFIVYKVTFDADSGVAIVEAQLHQGNPYDPNSEAILTVSGSAIVGETLDLNGEKVEITSPCMALYYAARDASRQLIEQKFWEQINGGTTSPPSTG